MLFRTGRRERTREHFTGEGWQQTNTCSRRCSSSCCSFFFEVRNSKGWELIKARCPRPRRVRITGNSSAGFHAAGRGRRSAPRTIFPASASCTCRTERRVFDLERRNVSTASGAEPSLDQVASRSLDQGGVPRNAARDLRHRCAEICGNGTRPCARCCTCTQRGLRGSLAEPAEDRGDPDDRPRAAHNKGCTGCHTSTGAASVRRTRASSVERNRRSNAPRRKSSTTKRICASRSRAELRCVKGFAPVMPRSAPPHRPEVRRIVAFLNEQN